jgi:hypothetical protein
MLRRTIWGQALPPEDFARVREGTIERTVPAADSSAARANR